MLQNLKFKTSPLNPRCILA
uniref:Uncharacterized protein n=1 Tax=Rhizophora mucronata TaxID=61149 RepID=A0A2P2QF32_RHIMU